MLTLQEAKTLALETLAKWGSDTELAFLDEHAQCKGYGWVLFYNSKKYVETGDFLYALGGNGPIVVMHDGSMHFLGTANAAATTIAAFEREHGL